MPAEAQAALEKTANAMRHFTIEFSEIEVDPDVVASAGPTSYSVLFREKQFYINSKRATRDQGKVSSYTQEIAHDGTILYVGHPLVQGEPQPANLTRFLVSDANDPVRTKRKWGVPYLDAAGFYIPVRITELDGFGSVEPLVLRLTKESTATEIEQTGETIRVTVRVPDRFLASAHDMDIDRFRAYREAFNTSESTIATEIDLYKHWRSLPRGCTITFLLNARFGYGTVEREERTSAGQRMVKTQSEGWKYYDKAGIWLPSQCVTYFYSAPYSYQNFSDTPVATNITTLSKVEFGSGKDRSFSLEYKEPGTVIEDRTVIEAQSQPKHQVLYTVAANGALLRGVAADVSNELNREQKIVWTVIVISLIGLPIVLFLRGRIRP